MGRSILARMAAGWKYDNFQIRISSTNLKPALNASTYPNPIYPTLSSPHSYNTCSIQKKPFTNLEAHTLPLYIHQHLAGIARSISHGEGIAAYFIAKSLIPDWLSFRENVILTSLYSLISFKSKGNISAKKVSPTSSETERIKS